MIKYSDNYSDTSGSLWQFKRDEQNINSGNTPTGVDSTNPKSFEYKSSFIKKPDDGAFKKVKIVVPLNYCKIHLELNWSKNCVMSNIVGAAKFKIKNTKLYVPIVTLSSQDNAKLVKQLGEGFNWPVSGMNTKQK